MYDKIRDEISRRASFLDKVGIDFLMQQMNACFE